MKVPDYYSPTDLESFETFDEEKEKTPTQTEIGVDSEEINFVLDEEEEEKLFAEEVDERENAYEEDTFSEPQNDEEQPQPQPQKEKLVVSIRNIIPIHPDLANEIKCKKYGIELTPKERQILEEDWENGFSRLNEKEKEWYGISDNIDTYATMSVIANKKLFCSQPQAKTYFKALFEKFEFPERYGFNFNESNRIVYTQMCVAELLDLVDHTREYTFPRGKNCIIDFRDYKNGDLKDPQKRIKNPRYHLRFDYWDEIRNRCEEWKAWHEAHKSTNISVTTVVFGEYVPDNDHDKVMSSLVHESQEIEQNFCGLVKGFGNQVYQKLKPLAQQEGVKVRNKLLMEMEQTAKTGQVEDFKDTANVDSSNEEGK